MNTYLDNYLEEMTPSALRSEVKHLMCYLSVAAFTQAQNRRFQYRTSTGHQERLPHAKIMSISCILTGKPGSYKSEAVRMLRKVMESTKQVTVYPHDQVSREYLVTTLAALQAAQAKESQLYDPDTKTIRIPKDPKPVSCSVYVEELVNFLNRREYVEPLVGALNTLLDQPPSYGAGTQSRGAEILHRPLLSFVAACAPSWFSELPETLFTGGFAGRCAFYYVPYPRDEDRQPRGQVCLDGGEERLGRALAKGAIPDGDLILSSETLKIHDKMEREWGQEKAHPIPVLDEWYKRRAIQTTRWSGCIALAKGSQLIEPAHWDEAHSIMEEVGKTLEQIWFEVESDQKVRWIALKLHIGDSQLTMSELEAQAVNHLRAINTAHSTIKWWQENGILEPVPGNKWQLSEQAKTALSMYNGLARGNPAINNGHSM